MAIVAPDYTAWSKRYPEFVAAAPNGPAVPETLYEAYFAEAGMYLNNTDASPVGDVGRRLILLNMITAHIAALNMPGSSPLVGRITDATEGSVSVTVNYEALPGSEQWFAQTKYGAAYWQATLTFRSARYRPAPGYGAGGRPLGILGFGGTLGVPGRGW